VLKRVKPLSLCIAALLFVGMVGLMPFLSQESIQPRQNVVSHATDITLNQIVVNYADYNSFSALPVQHSSDVASVAQSVAPRIVVNYADYNSFSALPVESFQPLAITNVSQNPPNGSVLPTDVVSVNATITDTISTVTQVFLNYTNGNGTWIMAHNMTNLVGNTWNSTIPQFPYGTKVTYVVEADDNLGNTIMTQQLGYTLQYTVTPEFPTLLVVFPFLIVTFLAVLLCKKKRSNYVFAG
jgi:hypothetical protein